ncbi:MAG: EAL domain-containing protein, partial [Micromonosporaceae bacterium]|nr:EAL domain-containing protein [Micromonosporaceae bacterium]
GVLASGVSVTGAGVSGWFAPAALVGGMPVRVGVPLLGLLGASTAYLGGLVLMPGVRLSPLGYARRLLDGVAIGVCGLFLTWLLLFLGDGVRPATLTAVVGSCVAFCAMVVAGLRSAAGRSAALACGGGIALSIAGLAHLIVVLEYGNPPERTVVSATAVLVGAALIRRATDSVVAGGPVLDPLASDTGFGGYPLFALPLAAALLAWGFALASRRDLDATSTVLAFAAVVTVAVRGAVASSDARSFASRLATREAQFRSLSAGSTDVVMILDARQAVHWQSPAAARQLGLSDQDVVGRPLVTLVHPEDRWRACQHVAGAVAGAGERILPPVEVRMRDGFGAWRDVEWRIVDHRSIPALGALVVHLRDVGERRQLEHHLERSAFLDPSTGLPNRRELCRVLGERGEPGVVMVLCLGGIGSVNDTSGHGAGETVLVEAARRLREGVDRADTAVRLDGARFAVLTSIGAVQAQFLAVRLLGLLTAPYPLPGGPARLSAGAGLAEHTPGLEGDEVLRRAELALRGTGRWEAGDAVAWYDEAVEAALRRRVTIEQALPELLDGSDLVLHYQPVVALPAHRPIGVEARLLWRHPALGEIAADEFMPVAERLGLADAIVGWMLHRACRALAGWLRDWTDLWLSLDVDPVRLADPRFLPTLETALSNHLVPASNLIIEVGEAGLTPAGPGSGSHRAVVGDPAAAARADVIADRLAELRSLGVRIALDHFGTLSNSLSRLRVLPIDLLKVDRDLFCQPRSAADPAPPLIEVVVRLGDQLGLTVAAQELQTEADLAAVLAAGCQCGQGDVICPPLTAERFREYLDRRNSDCRR